MSDQILYPHNKICKLIVP